MATLTRYTRKFRRLQWWQKTLVLLVVFGLVDYYFGFGVLNALKAFVPYPLETFESSQAENQPTTTLQCTMYYTTWCGYCKKAKPEWSRIESEFNGKTINGKTIIITKIDCDEHPEIAKEQNIQGYPTFKFQLAGQDIAFDGERTYDAFKRFIEKVVNQDRN